MPTYLGRGNNDASALGDVRDSKLGHPESTVDVGLDGTVELFSRDVGNVGDRVHLVISFRHREQLTCVTHDRSVVDEHVDPAPRLHNRVNDPLAPGLIPDVLGEEQALPAGSLDHRLGLFRVGLLFGQVHNGDIGTFERVHDRGGTADTRVTASDDRLLVDELAGGLVVVERVLAFLEGGSFGLAVHVFLHTDDAALLGLDGERIGLGELALRLYVRQGYT